MNRKVEGTQNLDLKTDLLCNLKIKFEQRKKISSARNAVQAVKKESDWFCWYGLKPNKEGESKKRSSKVVTPIWH